MKSFDINITGETYTIYPLENGEYQINQGHFVLGVITPNVGYSGVKWSGQALGNDLAQQIGELIEEHEM